MDGIVNKYVSEFSYDQFFASYQKSISILLNKLKHSRRKEKRMKSYNKDLQIENNYFREEIQRLENSEDNVRNLLSDKSKKLNYLEGIVSNGSYKIYYKLKYSFNNSSDIFESEWYDSEVDALKCLDSNVINFTIEKSYQKVMWSDDE